MTRNIHGYINTTRPHPLSHPAVSQRCNRRDPSRCHSRRIPSPHLVCACRQERSGRNHPGSIRTSWNLETYGLFRLPASAPAHPLVHDYVVEACHVDTDCPNRMEWSFPSTVSRLMLSAASFRLCRRYNSLGNLNQYRRDELPGAFGKPGWLRTVTEWVEAQAAAAGLHVTGTVRQLNASPTFSLLRFETDGRAVVQSRGPAQSSRAPRHTEACFPFPEFLPRILASRPEWNAWLAVESTGASLDVNSKTSAWESAAENLALLQISSSEGDSSLSRQAARILDRIASWISSIRFSMQ